MNGGLARPHQLLHDQLTHARCALPSPRAFSVIRSGLPRMGRIFPLPSLTENVRLTRKRQALAAVLKIEMLGISAPPAPFVAAARAMLYMSHGLSCPTRCCTFAAVAAPPVSAGNPQAKAREQTPNANASRTSYSLFRLAWGVWRAVLLYRPVLLRSAWRFEWRSPFRPHTGDHLDREFGLPSRLDLSFPAAEVDDACSPSTLVVYLSMVERVVESADLSPAEETPLFRKRNLNQASVGRKPTRLRRRLAPFCPNCLRRWRS
jgi:hypothetical protein